MWQGGDKMPESAVRRIRRSIKLWLIVKILPFAAIQVDGQMLVELRHLLSQIPGTGVDH